MSEPSSQAAAAPDLAGGSISHLHKMSVTAGVTTEGYAALSGLAVGSLVMGAVSLLPLFLEGYWISAGLCLLTAVVAAVSLVRIARSRGTLAGRMLAWAGLALGVGGAAVGAWQALSEGTRDRPDIQRVNATIDQLGQLLVSGEYEKAYGLFHGSYREQVPLAAFVEHWKNRVANSPRMGRLSRIEGTGRVQFVQQGAMRLAATKTIVRFGAREWSERMTFVLAMESDGQWRIANTELHPLRPPGAKGAEE
jgi:hypothetical protein